MLTFRKVALLCLVMANFTCKTALAVLAEGSQTRALQGNCMSSNPGSDCPLGPPPPRGGYKILTDMECGDDDLQSNTPRDFCVFAGGSISQTITTFDHRRGIAMVFWSNRRFEPLLREFPEEIQREAIYPAALAALHCLLEEAHSMIVDHANAPASHLSLPPGGPASQPGGNVQPANLTRYTECLTNAPAHLGLGQDGHRGIVVSVVGPTGVWPKAPIQVWTGEGHIFRERLGRHSITDATIRGLLQLEPEAELPPLPGLDAIPVPDLAILIHPKQYPPPPG